MNEAVNALLIPWTLPFLLRVQQKEGESAHPVVPLGVLVPSFDAFLRRKSLKNGILFVLVLGR